MRNVNSNAQEQRTHSVSNTVAASSHTQVTACQLHVALLLAIVSGRSNLLKWSAWAQDLAHVLTIQTQSEVLTASTWKATRTHTLVTTWKCLLAHLLAIALVTACFDTRVTAFHDSLA